MSRHYMVNQKSARSRPIKILILAWLAAPASVQSDLLSGEMPTRHYNQNCLILHIYHIQHHPFFSICFY